LSLNRKQLEFLKDNHKYFGVGVSYDFYGSDRKTKNNRNTNAIIKGNIKILRDNNISFGIITMLTKSNVRHIDKIYEFIRSNDVRVTFYHVLNSPGNKGRTGLSDKEYTKAVSKLVEMWWYDEDAKGCVGNAIHFLRRILYKHKEPFCIFAKNCQIYHIDIVPDGGVYPCIDLYGDEFGDEFEYGNIYTDSLEKIFASPKRKVWAGRSRIIRGGACKKCVWLEFCEGGCPHRAFLSGEGLWGRDSLCLYNSTMFNQVMQYLKEEGLIKKDGKTNRDKLKSVLRNGI
jgi:uncharacterized protein